jgi:RimJ/RimL family protein N-acetyltransferase
MIVSNDAVAAFIVGKIQRDLHPPFSVIGREVDGRIVAGASFSTYQGYDIEITVAAEPGGITRALLRAWGQYVRDQLGCGRVSITTEQPFVVGLAKRLGGQVEGLKRHAFGPDRHGYHVGILKEEWKF